MSETYPAASDDLPPRSKIEPAFVDENGYAIVFGDPRPESKKHISHNPPFKASVIPIGPKQFQADANETRFDHDIDDNNPLW